MENRNGLAVEAILTHATGTAERAATLVMRGRKERRTPITPGADKAYDVTDFVTALRARGVTAHIAVNGTVSKLGVVRKTASDAATTGSDGYAISQRCRKRIEEVFGWIKEAAGLASVKVRGKQKVDATFTLAIAAYNRIPYPETAGKTRNLSRTEDNNTDPTQSKAPGDQKKTYQITHQNRNPEERETSSATC